ncbi:MAG: hypothetical protein HQL47_00780 [Gammaproteobacteria bacterium]|nr:hypothetical protein [Gammaproteobacteria bacterium]
MIRSSLLTTSLFCLLLSGPLAANEDSWDQAGKKTKEAAGALVDATGDTAGKVWSSTKQTGKQAWKAGKNGADNLWQKAKKSLN